MKLPKRFLRKVLLGAVLIALSVCVTIFIKETLDTKDPEAALPIITLLCNETPVPPESVYRAGYTWSFFTTVEDWQAPSMAPEDLPIKPVDIAANTPIVISFSSEPSALRIWRAEGMYSSDFLELSGDVPGEFLAPATAGQYMYRVNADWGSRGNIQYYFALSVTG